MTQQSTIHQRIPDQHLIGIFVEVNGHETIRYFRDEVEADVALAGQDIEEVLALAGAFSDLDWDEAKRALDQIRHQSVE